MCTFSPTSSTDYNTNKSSSWRLFFCQKRQIQRLLLVFLETFVAFGDSKARITLQLGLLCSTSSGCCREPLSRPKLDLWHRHLASVEGTATCSPALQTLSLMQARHTISPPYFNQRLSTCQQWENSNAMNQLWGGPACKRLRTPALMH